MADSAFMLVQVLSVPEVDDESHVRQLTRRLEAELRRLDLDSVEVLTADNAPDNAKGIGTLAGWLRIGLGSLQRLSRTMSALIDWAIRNNREIECMIDGKKICIKGATTSQGDKIVEAWVNDVTAGN
jgi:hypothetical protein